MEAAFQVAKGSRRMIDITELTGEYETKKIYSFLSVAWAIIADCDINSEAIRCVGSARFTIWGVWRVLCMRRYLGKLSYFGKRLTQRQVPSDAAAAEQVDNEALISTESDQTYENDQFLHFIA